MNNSAKVIYSFGNEDFLSEQKALKVQPFDRVLCISASGDRPLHKLLNECHHVVSIDTNPAQNFLLELKLTAMKHLSFPEYLAFLGVAPSENRKSIFENLSEHLSPSCLLYWKKNIKMIEKGVLYQGFTERYFTNACAWFVHLTQKKKIKKLFSFNCLEEQKEFVDKNFKNKPLIKAFDFVMKAKFIRKYMKSAAVCGNVEQPKAGTFLFESLKSSLNKHIANKNFFVSLLLQGKVSQDALPPYLTEQGVNSIRNRLDKISIVTQDLITYLKNCPDNCFDCFSLSDVASFIPSDDYKIMLKHVYRTAKPGARFCMRQFMTNHTIPDMFSGKFTRNVELEKDLQENDRCFLYKFMTGTINK